MASMKCEQCGSKGRIDTSSEQSLHIKYLYYSCKNEHCNHRWRATLSFDHSIEDNLSIAFKAFTNLNTKQLDALREMA